MQKVTVYKNDKQYDFRGAQDADYISLDNFIKKIIENGDSIEQVITTKTESRVMFSVNKEVVTEAIIIHHNRLSKAL